MDTLGNTDTPLINTERKAIDEGKDTNDIDEIITNINICLGIIYYIIAIIPFYNIVTFLIPYKDMVILDSKKKIIVCRKSIWCCKFGPKKIYDYSQIKRIRLYVSSTPDPERPFDRLYFSNADIYSFDGQQDSLFNSIKYNEEKFNKMVKIFEKHFNIDVEPIDVCKNNINFNNSPDDQIITTDN